MLIDRDLCDVCGACAAVCPQVAITIREFETVINPDICINCHICEQMCPAQAIQPDGNLSPSVGGDGNRPAFVGTQLAVSNTPDTYDVIIIGAGPAGSVTARFLAESGLKTLLLERDREPGIPVRCAEGVSHAGIIPFIDIDPKWICTKIDGAILHAPDGNSVEMYNNGTGYVLDRRVFDRALADLAVSKGTILKTKADAIGLIKNEQNQICGVRYRHEKTIHSVNCQIVIGADGVESQVSRWAGFKSCLSAEDIDVCCQYTVNNISTPVDMCQFYFGKEVAPGGYLWIFPKSPTQANIGVGIGGDDAKPGKGPRYYLDKFMDAHYPNASINYMVYGGVPTKAGNDFIADNIMLVGDAAYQVNPITGGGIVQGMLAGKYAAETAIKAIANKDTSVKNLADYPAKWEAHLGNNQRFLYSLKQKFMGMNDKIFNTIVSTCKKIPRDELDLYRLFKETLKEDPILLARLATSFVISKIK